MSRGLVYSAFWTGAVITLANMADQFCLLMASRTAAVIWGSKEVRKVLIRDWTSLVRGSSCAMLVRSSRVILDVEARGV